MSFVKRLGVAAAFTGLVAVGLTVAPQHAHAWWRGGVGYGVVIGPPVVVAPPPPVYVAPPVVYAAPPPVVYAQPRYYAPRPVWVPGHWRRGYWVPGHWG
ncbi:MAG: hypothetical protein U1E70_00245 [Acetobacteraceae bacterium]|nr:hypothetical protein [Pseudomonadota bacterium]